MYVNRKPKPVRRCPNARRTAPSPAGRSPQRGRAGEGRQRFHIKAASSAKHCKPELVPLPITTYIHLSTQSVCKPETKPANHLPTAARIPTGIDGKQRGRGERIARHRLQEQAADRHHRADQERGQNTWQPHRQHHALIERQIGGGRMGERGKHRARARAFRQKKPGRIQTKRRQQDGRQQPFQPRGKRFHARRPGLGE